MARILAYTSPARGHLFPLTPIMDALSARGHDLAVRTLASQVPLMHSRGFEAAPISADVERIELDDWKARGPRQALARSVRGFVARARFDAPDLTAAIAAERPDVLLADINAWGALAAAEACGGPWAAFCPYPMALRSVDAPPFGPGLAPARGPLGRLRDRVVRPLVWGALEKELLPALNRVRAVVLVTASSKYQNDHRLVEAAWDRLANEPFAVVATAPAGDPLAVRPPPNAWVERFLPHSQLLGRAVCAVTHGGMGATQKALAHGVPVCVVPLGRDQFEVARRVDTVGAGSRLPARRLTPERLRAKVHEAISRAPGAQRVAAAFRTTGGPMTAADAVERRLLAVHQ